MKRALEFLFAFWNHLDSGEALILKRRPDPRVSRSSSTSELRLITPWARPPMSAENGQKHVLTAVEVRDQVAQVVLRLPSNGHACLFSIARNTRNHVDAIVARDGSPYAPLIQMMTCFVKGER